VASVDPADPRGAAFLDQAAELLRGAAYTVFGVPEPAGVDRGAGPGRDGAAGVDRGAGPGREEGAAGVDRGAGSGREKAADAMGHGGVGAPYAHVTAPLRRLADRYATEISLSLYAGSAIPEWAAQALPRLPKAMSATDRLAGAADRGAIDLAEAVLLQGRVGEVFEAAVLDRDEANGKRPAGGTIALDEPAVRAKCVGDLPLGQRIRVRLTAADPASRAVGFERV
jgi:hypothetical protein